MLVNFMNEHGNVVSVNPHRVTYVSTFKTPNTPKNMVRIRFGHEHSVDVVGDFDEITASLNLGLGASL